MQQWSFLQFFLSAVKHHQGFLKHAMNHECSDNQLAMVNIIIVFINSVVYYFFHIVEVPALCLWTSYYLYYSILS